MNLKILLPFLFACVTLSYSIPLKSPKLTSAKPEDGTMKLETLELPEEEKKEIHVMELNEEPPLTVLFIGELCEETDHECEKKNKEAEHQHEKQRVEALEKWIAHLGPEGKKSWKTNYPEIAEELEDLKQEKE